jgi:hypothetical protein
MTESSLHHDEILALAGAMRDGALDARRAARLKELLAADPSARQVFARSIFLQAMLELELGASRRGSAMPSQCESRSVKAEELGLGVGDWGLGAGDRTSQISTPSAIRRPKSSALQQSAPTLPVIVISPVEPPRVSWFSPGSFLFFYMMSAIILGVAMLGAWAYKISPADPDALAAIISRNNQNRDASRFAAAATSALKQVGSVTGVADVRWADQRTETIPGAAVFRGRKYALASGLLEITYDCGAKVILQGPCEYTVESPRGGFLAVGKLVARVGAGNGGLEAGANLLSPFGRKAGGEGIQSHSQSALTLTLSQRERGQNFSPTPHTPLPTPLFSVRTPTAVVEDLGTEFGVMVGLDGNTVSHVFQGHVRVRIEGAGDGERGTGEQASKSEIILSAGQSAAVEREGQSGRLKLAPDHREVAPREFVRRLHEPPKMLDLLDIVAGGNGLGHRRERGIDPATGMQDPVFVAQEHAGSRQYRQVLHNALIDGLFVPDGRPGAVQLDSAGHIFNGFPKTSGGTFGSIWSRGETVMHDERVRDPSYWIFAMGCDERFTPEHHGLLGLHPNVGITFSLKTARDLHPGLRPSRFHATAGLGNAQAVFPERGGYNREAGIWVFVDGRLKFNQLRLRPQDAPERIDVEIGPDDNFLTLASTAGGSDKQDAWVVFGDPVLEMSPCDGKEVAR